MENVNDFLLRRKTEKITQKNNMYNYVLKIWDGL